MTQFCKLHHDHKHGDNSTCYTKGKCRCDDCREWNTGYHFMRRQRLHLGRTMPHSHIDSAPTIRRIQALACLGWSMPAIAEASGVGRPENVLHVPTVRRSTAAAIARTYDALSMKLPVPADRYHWAAICKTRSQARKRGWLPPLAYDDIDHPNETNETNTKDLDERASA